jgi:quercetin dioxygenase-like cupin family protein
MRRAVASILLGVTALLANPPLRAMELDPKAIAITVPDQIPWGPLSPQGAQQAVLAGDPAKPGLYAVLTKWTAGHMSHPHFHPNDRYITVISGTWWVGTGDKWDPTASVPVHEGSFVTHFGKQVHWDGAKEGDVVLLIVGMGPADATPAPGAH